MNVHVRAGSAAGLVVYDLLIDSGDDRMAFKTGNGWVNKRDLTPSGWVLCDGWAPPHADGCARIAYRAGALPKTCNCGR